MSLPSKSSTYPAFFKAPEATRRSFFTSALIPRIVAIWEAMTQAEYIKAVENNVMADPIT